jgi:two-component system, sensor histidine kinase and response regulator
MGCLVIEDSSNVRAVMCRLLASCGCETEEADGPAGAIGLLKDHPYDALFLDWDLPDFGALDILREVNRLDARPHVILCVTHNDPRELALANAAGAKHILMKPYDEDMVAEVLASIGDETHIEQQQPKTA